MPSQPRQGMMKISELQVNPEYVTLLPPLSDEDSKNLEESILKDGVLHPFLINPDKVILDGHHRLTICKRHAINEVPVIERSFNTDLEEIEFVIYFNLNRRQLTLTQKVELGLTFHKIEMIKAKERQGTRTDLITNKEEVNNIPPNLEESDEEPGEATEKAAKKVGLGKNTFRKGKRIAEAAQTDKRVYTLWRDIADGNRSIDSVYEELFQQEEPPTSCLPPSRTSPLTLEGVFQVIVIDLPITKLEKLKEIVHCFDEKNCVLWLWISFKFIPTAFDLLHHYQFQPQTMLTWIKNKKDKGKWLRNQTELCILATRGKPVANLTYQSTALLATTAKRHSKPDEFYALVESLFTDSKKLNVSTSTMQRPGWEELRVSAND